VLARGVHRSCLLYQGRVEALGVAALYPGYYRVQILIGYLHLPLVGLAFPKARSGRLCYYASLSHLPPSSPAQIIPEHYHTICTSFWREGQLSQKQGLCQDWHNLVHSYTKLSDGLLNDRMPSMSESIG